MLLYLYFLNIDNEIKHYIYKIQFDHNTLNFVNEIDLILFKSV